MADLCIEYPNVGGFSFENCSRNALLAQKGFTAPKYTKTGTTIVGMKFKDGIILGADTRATEDTIVAELNCEKIHYIADNIYCCGAGTAADTEMTTKMISSKLELHRLNTSRTPRVVTAERMLAQKLFRYQGHIGAALILGGVDPAGIHLYQIYPHGSTDELPFVTMGSGSLAAMSVFESGWRADLPRDEAMELVRNAIRAGIFNDLGSGSNVDLCILTKDKTDYLRNYELANKKGVRQGSYRYKQGTTAVLQSSTKKIEFDITSTRVTPGAPTDDTMDTS